MVFYSFYTDKFRDPASLVYRTESGWSQLQVGIKLFPQKEGDNGAERDFFSLLWDNEDFRLGEYFDTEKGKKKAKDTIAIKTSEPVTYNTIPEGFTIELDKVYNLDCILFMKELPDKYIDYMFTSPPYNIKKQIGEGDLYGEYADDLTSEEYFNWLCALIDEGMRVTKKHFFMNIQMLGKNKLAVLELFGKYRYIIKDRMVWVKTIAAPHIQPGIMNSKFEDIIIFSNDRPDKKVFSDAKWSQGTFNNVIQGLNASRNQYSDLNKATFPLYLPRTFMINFGKPNDIWYDPFSGTGTTFHACIKEDRRFLGTEIDTAQCEATNKRVFIEESKLEFGFDFSSDASITAEIEYQKEDNELQIKSVKIIPPTQQTLL